MQPSLASVLTIAFGLLVGACRHPAKDKQSTGLPGDNLVLAEVDGEVISEYDVRAAVRDTFGADRASGLSAQSRKQVLQSLVATRAIARAQEGKLTPTERAEIDKRTQAYREELIVQLALKKRGSAPSVSPAEIRKYYDAHLERFGAQLTRHYELLGASRPLSDAERLKVISAWKSPKPDINFSEVATTLAGEGLPIVYRTGTLLEQALHPSLRSALEALKIGEVSPMVFIEGRAYLLRVTSEERATARPFSEVAAEIRQLLAPSAVRQAVEQASNDVLKTAKVTYK